MKERIFLVTVVIFIWSITPSWFVSDFLFLTDKAMLVGAVIGLVLYKLKSKFRSKEILSLVLLVNSFVYFVISANLIYSDIENDRIVYRLELILGTKFLVPRKIGDAIEFFNMIQAIIETALILVVLILIFRERRMTAKKVSKNE